MPAVFSTNFNPGPNGTITVCYFWRLFHFVSSTCDWVCGHCIIMGSQSGGSSSIGGMVQGYQSNGIPLLWFDPFQRYRTLLGSPSLWSSTLLVYHWVDDAVMGSYKLTRMGRCGVDAGFGPCHCVDTCQSTIGMYILCCVDVSRAFGVWQTLLTLRALVWVGSDWYKYRWRNYYLGDCWTMFVTRSRGNIRMGFWGYYSRSSCAVDRCPIAFFLSK